MSDALILSSLPCRSVLFVQRKVRGRRKNPSESPGTSAERRYEVSLFPSATTLSPLLLSPLCPLPSLPSACTLSPLCPLLPLPLCPLPLPTLPTSSLSSTLSPLCLSPPPLCHLRSTSQSISPCRPPLPLHLLRAKGKGVVASRFFSLFRHPLFLTTLHELEWPDETRPSTILITPLSFCTIVISHLSFPSLPHFHSPLSPISFFSYSTPFFSYP